MNIFDWTVICAYLCALIAIAGSCHRRQDSIADYYLAGKNMRWWQSGLSVMATQLGAISFVSAPAFVAVKQGGGLQWLCYEFGVPIGLLFVMAVIVPAVAAGRHISMYEYLEERFDAQTRSLVSFLFQIGRGLATAVSMLAGGLILSTCMGISTSWAILVVGAATITYDALGGIRAVIISDVLQMMLIVAGIVICGATGLWLTGWSDAWAVLSPARMDIVDFKRFGLTSAGEYSFWPMCIGGIFLYASYYGCDQSQMQRQMATRSIQSARGSLLLNALGRFPLVAVYCLLGVIVGSAVLRPEFGVRAAGLLPEGTAVADLLARDPDRMLPLFILAYLPHGVIGFLFAAILSALMSSLDSALNSLSAVTVRDFYQKYITANASTDHYLRVSKICTLVWGIFCVGAALAFANSPDATRQTTIVLINAVGSLLYGPVLAAFALGIATRWATAASVKAGALAGIICNCALWLLTDISWLWWNAAGFMAAVATAGMICLAGGSVKRAELPLITLPETCRQAHSRGWRLMYAALLLYTVLIIGMCVAFQKSV